MTWPGTPGLVITEPSMTVQGDTLPLSRILVRFANGIDLPQGAAQFGDCEDEEHEDYDWSKLGGLDLAEKEQLQRMNIELIKEVKEKAKKPKTEEPQNPPVAT